MAQEINSSLLNVFLPVRNFTFLNHSSSLVRGDALSSNGGIIGPIELGMNVLLDGSTTG